MSIHWLWKLCRLKRKNEKKNKSLYNFPRENSDKISSILDRKNVKSSYLCKYSYHIVPSHEIVDENHSISNTAAKRIHVFV